MLMGSSSLCRLLLACLLLLVAGCSGKVIGSAQNDHLPKSKVYTVRGKTYQTYASAHGFQEQGIASWYGPGFHGKLTANGEKYDQYAMTAAHKLLPFNTQLQVTNLDNGKRIVVRVNDRGPFVGDRVIDLSRRAAEQLGVVGPGTARVQLVAIGTKAPMQGNDGDMPGSYYVQLGSFKVEQNARQFMKKLEQQGLFGRIIRGNSGLLYVQIGPYNGYKLAETALARLKASHPGIFVIAE